MINCEFEDGKKANLRHVTVDAIAVKDGKILLVSRGQALTQGGKYAFPGGYLDRGETPEQAALRELREETGYEGSIKRLVTILADPKRDDRQNVSFVFEIHVGERTGEPDSESSRVDWIELKALPDKEQFAFDHFDVLRNFLATSRSK